MQLSQEEFETKYSRFVLVWCPVAAFSLAALAHGLTDFGRAKTFSFDNLFAKPKAQNEGDTPVPTKGNKVAYRLEGPQGQ